MPSTMRDAEHVEEVEKEEEEDEDDTIPVHGVQLGPLLGKGSYGRVYLGMWENMEVAVKV